MGTPSVEKFFDQGLKHSLAEIDLDLLALVHELRSQLSNPSLLELDVLYISKAHTDETKKDRSENLSPAHERAFPY